MTNETTALTEQQDDTERKRRLALLKAVGLDRVPPEQRELALAIAKRYDLDLMLKHLILVEGRPYITRDGLLHIAHRSGQLDGIEATEPVLENGFWRATASVFRKDMTRPFRYYGRYPEKGKNKDYGPEMATKVAESMALRRAFDISAPTVDEQWDRDMPEAPVAPPPATLRERVEQRRNEMATRLDDKGQPLAVVEGKAPIDEMWRGPGLDEFKGRAKVAGPARAEEPTAEPAAPIVEDEPEAILGDPMTVEASAAKFTPSMCGNEDKGLDTGECELFAGHQGPHRNAGGVWPNK